MSSIEAIIFIWICTIFASYGIVLHNTIFMLKDIVNAGYKLKSDAFEEFIRTIKSSSNTLFIPFLNLRDALKMKEDYNDNQLTFLSELNILNALLPLSKDEQKEYDKNPKLITVLNLCLGNEKTDNLELTIQLPDSQEESKITYKYDEIGHPIIIKTDGPINQKNILEQRSLLLKQLTILEKEKMKKEEDAKIENTQKPLSTLELDKARKKIKK